MALPRICPNCGCEMDAEEIAAGRFKCGNTAKCVKRAMAAASERMLTKKYVGGFNPDAAYREAPKIGDAK